MDRHGIIRDRRTGKPIGVKPRRYKTPTGTWNYYPNVKAIEQEELEQGPPEIQQESRQGPDVSLDGLSELFGIKQSGRQRRNPFDLSF